LELAAANYPAAIHPAAVSKRTTANATLALGWCSCHRLGCALRAVSGSSTAISAGTTPNLVFDNPIGVLGKDTVEQLVGVWIAGLLALIVTCAVALFVRYRRANDTERKQIKWLLYASAVFLVVDVGGFVSGLGGTASFGGYIWGVFFGLSVITLPAAIGIAILKYRLYDIDLERISKPSTTDVV
jgi:hypothetical protein